MLSMQARAKELKMELLNSKRLEEFFEEHPSDLNLLKHDKPLAATQVGRRAGGNLCSHLYYSPEYSSDALVAFLLVIPLAAAQVGYWAGGQGASEAGAAGSAGAPRLLGAQRGMCAGHALRDISCALFILLFSPSFRLLLFSPSFRLLPPACASTALHS